MAGPSHTATGSPEYKEGTPVLSSVHVTVCPEKPDESKFKLELKATGCIYCKVKFPQAFSDIIPILYIIFPPCR